MAANVKAHHHYYDHQLFQLLCCPKFPFYRNPNLGAIKISSRLSISRHRNGYGYGYGCCYAADKYNNKSMETTEEEEEEEERRPSFDINLAVILAGFAFEAYTTPEKREVVVVDAAGCHTLIISQSFLRELYDGQLFITVNKGYDFPAMDPWGTSDPYVVLQLEDSQIVKTKVKWGTKEPTWNEQLTLYTNHPPTYNLQVAAWDANLVAPHKRMGNSTVSLDSICDGNSHQLLVELEGMGGGGKLQLQVKYKSFDTIEEEKNWWRLPFVAEFLRNNGFESTLKKVIGSEPVQARQFVEYAFGQLKSINDAFDGSSNVNKYNLQDSTTPTSFNSQSDIEKIEIDAQVYPEFESTQSDKDFWKSFGNAVNQNIVKQLGLPAPEKIKWEGFDLLSKIGIHSQTVAEAGYVESGLATPSSNYTVNNDEETTESSSISNIIPSFPDIKKATQDLLKQTDSILGALMVLNATVTELTKDGAILAKSDTNNEENAPEGSFDKPVLDEKKAEEMRALFSTAESAMEAWAMLATSLGHPSFIKSEFEKICFLDNPATDTQVAIWRDLARNRLVVAFRGTEQVKWKDLRTDLMLVPTGLNPERIGGDYKEEVQVHSGFLGAYDSVRTRIISLIKTAIGYKDDEADQVSKWHVYVTGHSLGGALATLLALELSSSQLAKRGAISVTMYNFGSPRVGNKKFADVYNQKVKDSWRVVNHRDIIPSVPRLMGYCHVAQPVYLAAGNVPNAMENIEALMDGYEGDIIGESTPDALVTEFMKGEKELIEKILNTEINIFRAIRDGTALMQHMEDFYYVSLLEHVRSTYTKTTKSSRTGDGDGLSVKEA